MFAQISNIQQGINQMSKAMRMKWVAGGVLLLAAALFVVAKVCHIGWLEAFSEAAMVGGLADWFAVVALFRRPLGLPIPHTAVIPNRKDEIGKTLGQFVAENFLTREVVSQKIEGMDLTVAAGKWLEENASVVTEKVTGLIPGLLEGLDEDEIKRLIKRELRAQVGKIDFAGTAAGLLETLTAQGKHREVLLKILGGAQEMLEKKKSAIAEEVYQELPLKDLLKIPLIGETVIEGVRRAASTAVAGLLVNKIQRMLEIAKTDETHMLSSEFEDAVERLVINLRESQEYRQKAEDLKQRLLGSKELGGYMESLWDELKRKILDDVSKSDSGIRRALSRGLAGFAVTLQREEVLKTRLNGWLKNEVAEFAEKHRHEVARMIEETVQRWDGKELADKLEEQTGADLQFIRLNGTVVGGLAGLLIYLVARLF